MEIQLWKEILSPYEQAVDELLLKFKHIIKDYRSQGLYSPIENVTGRVKRISSILDKMQKKHIPMDHIVEEMDDIAGIRIMCQFEEDIYKVVIAATELSKTKTGALIVLERDINIQDIIATGVPMNSEISPQLLVNIFVPKTPLHDGAVVISNNKIAAAACVLPLANDQDIAKELGTRHRAAIGISKESDSIVVVVSEETGKISVAKDGTLIADVREDVLKKILISNIVTKRFTQKKTERNNKLEVIKKKFSTKTKNENTEENK